MANYNYDHAHIISPDPEAAAAFFVDKFGATIKSKGTAPDGTTMVSVDLHGANIFLEGSCREAHSQDTRPREHLRSGTSRHRDG